MQSTKAHSHLKRPTFILGKFVITNKTKSNVNKTLGGHGTKLKMCETGEIGIVFLTVVAKQLRFSTNHYQPKSK